MSTSDRPSPTESTAPCPIRVMIVDDQRLIRDGLHYLIDAEPDMKVVGEAAGGVAAVDAAVACRPNVILMDVQMPEGDGLTATRRIVAAVPSAKVVILTTFDIPEYVYDGIRAGAVGYLLKDAPADDLMACVRAVHAGQALYRTAAAAEALAQALTIAPGPVIAPEQQTALLDVEGLTERERAVLQQMAFGLRNDEIGKKLFISEGTVKTHVHRILQKLCVDDRTQAVVLALRSGIVD